MTLATSFLAGLARDARYSSLYGRCQICVALSATVQHLRRLLRRALLTPLLHDVQTAVVLLERLIQVHVSNLLLPLGHWVDTLGHISLTKITHRQVKVRSLGCLLYWSQLHVVM